MSRYDRARLTYQLGTLGGGNHFLELAYSPEGVPWLLVHSGSRYLGGLFATQYARARLQVGRDEGQEFFTVQKVVTDFARYSRAEIFRRAVQILVRHGIADTTVPLRLLDIGHNFVEKSASGLVLHRKGACAAPNEGLVVIPGDMASGSVIVQGLGSSWSYESSSHGAGRRMSRGKAFRNLRFSELERAMSQIVWSGQRDLLDEAPRAYKQLDLVLRAQRDLVRVNTKLTPVLSYKGGA